MARTPPIATRLRGLVNWPSNVRHPFLSSYIKHIFQNHEIAEPGIRSSTTGIWVNVTILQTDSSPDASFHPKVMNPVLEFKNVKLQEALGKLESRIKLYTKGGVARQGTDREITVEGHSYYSKITKNMPGHLLEAKQDPLKALQIYRDVPIHLRVNVIQNPLLNAQVLAQFIAKQTQKKFPNFQKVYKMLLQSL